MKKGFTLVELLVYVGIFAIVAGLMVGILTTTLKVNQRESASAEATSQLNFVMQTIQRLTRESSAIIVNSSSTNIDTDDTVGSQQTRLVLRMKDSGANPSTDRDPIIIYAENNVIKMSEGGKGFQRISDLTNSKVLADNLKFTKYTQYPGQDTVAVDIQLTYNSQNPDSMVSRSLRTAIARVSAANFDSNLLPGTDNQYEIGYLPNQRWKNISISNLLNLGQSPIDIVGAQNGSIYYNTSSTAFRGYASGTWANLGGISGGQTNYVPLWTSANTQTTSTIYQSSGNVGIGTTNPGATTNFTALNINGIDGSEIRLLKDNTYAGRLSSTLTETRLTAVASGSVMTFFTSSTEYMRITGTGNVGVGTTTPSQRLSVAGTIESTSGGFKFPDATTQTSAASQYSDARFKIINVSRDVSLTSDQTISGVGFTPNGVTIMATMEGTWQRSHGFDTVDSHYSMYYRGGQSWYPYVNHARSIVLTPNDSTFAWGYFSSFNSDGGVINWSNKAGSPTGTAELTMMFFR
jgi:type II secretory pathway pseudopilin PulG